MLRILQGTKIDFIRLWRIAAGFAGLFVIPGFILVLFTGFKTSVEFTGGTLMQLTFKDSIQTEQLRASLTAAGLPNAEPQRFGSAREYVVRVQNAEAVAQQEEGAEKVAAQIRAGLDASFGAGSYIVDRTELVGPRVGSELRQQAIVAMLIAFALTLVYLAWRFEWRFSVAAVLATVHDFLATLAFIKYMNIEISLFVVGGILTVIGYSMNDKVVVFDRVRENLHLTRKERLYDLLNRSVNETLPRTVMTGSTTLACLLALLIFGGDVIRPFSWVLTFGIVIGTFSSIYVASPLLLYIESRYKRADIAGRLAGPAGPMGPSGPTAPADAAVRPPQARTPQPARPTR